MPCSRRSKFEKPIWRTTVLMRAVDLAHDQRQQGFLVAGARQAVLEESERGHFAKYRCRLAVGDGGVEHQRPLRLAGKNAVDAVAEFVRQGHHVRVASQIIQESVGDRLPAGQNVRGVEGAAALFLHHRHVDATFVEEAFHDRGERGAEALVRRRHDAPPLRRKESWWYRQRAWARCGRSSAARAIPGGAPSACSSAASAARRAS